MSNLQKNSNEVGAVNEIARYFLDTYMTLVNVGNFIIKEGSYGNPVYVITDIFMEERKKWDNNSKEYTVMEPKVSVRRIWYNDKVDREYSYTNWASEYFPCVLWRGSWIDLRRAMIKADKIVRGGEVPIDFFRALPRGGGEAESTALARVDSKYAEVNRDEFIEVYLDNETKKTLINMASNNFMAEIKQNTNALKQKIQQALVPIKRVIRRLNALVRQLEIFLGIGNMLHTIQDGQEASDDEPIHIYQLPFYMDEEVGDPTNSGLDFRSIDKFDSWLTEYHPWYKSINFKRILPHPKSIAMFQVRRYMKDYSSDPFQNKMMQYNDRATYILIRNGDKVVRLWNTEYERFNLGKSLFPKPEELVEGKNSILDKLKEDNNLRKERDLEEQKEEFEKAEFKYRLNLLFLQGLLMRDEIFPRMGDKVDLFSGDILKNPFVKFVFDNKLHNELENKKVPSFSSWLKSINGELKKGDRILWNMANYDRSSFSGKFSEDKERMFAHGKNSYDDRAFNNLDCRSPDRGIYIVQEQTKTSYKPGTKEREVLELGDEGYAEKYSHEKCPHWHDLPSHNWDRVMHSKYVFLGLYIKFNPGGYVYKNWGYDSNERKNRIKYAIYQDDVYIKIDKIKRKDFQFLQEIMYDRKHRSSYVRVKGLISKVLEARKGELDIEMQFAELVYSNLLTQGKQFDDKEKIIDLIEDKIHWWKTKNKWKRPLMIGNWKQFYPGIKVSQEEEQQQLEKACRMIIKEVNKELC